MNAKDGTLVKNCPPRFSRSVIRSCSKWNYELVQKVLDGEITSVDMLDDKYKPLGQTFEDMASDCKLMNDIAQKRRHQRLENGSVMFMNREFTFSLDGETRYPLAYQESPKI
jgi:DIS3-like exonuclease 2